MSIQAFFELLDGEICPFRCIYFDHVQSVAFCNGNQTLAKVAVVADQDCLTGRERTSDAGVNGNRARTHHKKTGLPVFGRPVSLNLWFGCSKR